MDGQQHQQQHLQHQQQQQQQQQQQHTAPEQYFAVPDGTPDISDEDHATTVLGTSMALDHGGQVQTQQQQHHHHLPFAYLDGGNSGSIPHGNTSYGFGAESGSAGPSASYPTTTDWQQTGQDFMFANGAPYGYALYNEARHGDHTQSPALSHHGYVGSIDATLQMGGYSFNWDAQDAMSMGFDSTPLPSPTEYSSTAASQLETSTSTGTGTGTDSGTGASTSYASSRSDKQFSTSTIFTETTPLHTTTPAAEPKGGERERDRTAAAASKKNRTRHHPSRADRLSFQARPSSSATGSSSNSPGASSSSAMLRMGLSSSGHATRPSSHTTTRQHEKKEDKKTRGSHNLVEKQYRNRLNAQFEGLMNALPEGLKLQSPGGSVVVENSGEGDRGDNKEREVPDAPERKPSKAEVLEMARMHIRALEQERDSLVQERNGLLSDITRLQGVLASRSAAVDNVGDFWTGEEHGHDFEGDGRGHEGE